MGSDATATVFYGIGFGYQHSFPWGKSCYYFEEHIENEILKLDPNLTWEEKNSILKEFYSNVYIGRHGYDEDSQTYICIEASRQNIDWGDVGDLSTNFPIESENWDNQLNTFFEKIGIADYIKEQNIKIGWKIVAYYG